MAPPCGASEYRTMLRIHRERTLCTLPNSRENSRFPEPFPTGSNPGASNGGASWIRTRDQDIMSAHDCVLLIKKLHGRTMEFLVIWLLRVISFNSYPAPFPERSLFDIQPLETALDLGCMDSNSLEREVSISLKNPIPDFPPEVLPSIVSNSP